MVMLCVGDSALLTGTSAGQEVEVNQTLKPNNGAL